MKSSPTQWTLSHKLALGLFLSWLIGSVVLAWHYFYIPFVPFTEDLDAKALSEMTLTTTDERYVAVHIIDPDCICNRFSQTHISELKEKYQNLKHVDLHPRGEQEIIKLDGPIPASPSVALFRPSGKLVYFGPYNGGAVCGEGFDFFRMAIEDASDQEASPRVNLLQYGCYCPWPD